MFSLQEWRLKFFQRNLVYVLWTQIFVQPIGYRYPLSHYLVTFFYALMLFRSALRQQNRSSSYKQSYCRDFLHEREMSFDSMMKATMMEPDADLPSRSLFDLWTIRPSHCELLKAKHLCFRRTSEETHRTPLARVFHYICGDVFEITSRQSDGIRL